MDVKLPMCLLDWINSDKIDWQWMSSVPSENAMQLVETNLDRINLYCWKELSENPSAIHLLKKNQDKINWVGLSSNPSEGAIQLLEKNQNKIHWDWLSSNTSDRAMQLLEKNQDKINWWSLSKFVSSNCIAPSDVFEDK